MVSNYRKMTAIVESNIKQNQDSNTVHTNVNTKQMIDKRKLMAF